MPGGWPQRHDPLPDDWPARRTFVRQRAGGRCEWADQYGRCPAEGERCDHIINVRSGGTHDVSNLQWLCEPHHNYKTAYEGLAAHPGKPSAKHPVEKHPGLL